MTWVGLTVPLLTLPLGGPAADPYVQVPRLFDTATEVEREPTKAALSSSPTSLREGSAFLQQNKLENELNLLFAAAIGERSPGLFPSWLTPSALQSVQQLFALKRALEKSRVLIEQESAVDVAHVATRSTSYKFTLNGFFVSVISAERSRVTVEMYRGYWKHYERARVFFGRGVSCAYKIDGFSFFGIDALSRYEATTDLDVPKDLDGQLVLQQYGSEEALVVIPAITAARMAAAHARVMSAVHQRAKALLESDTRLVEPIIFSLPPDGLADYTSPRSRR